MGCQCTKICKKAKKKSNNRQKVTPIEQDNQQIEITENIEINRLNHKSKRVPLNTYIVPVFSFMPSMRRKKGEKGLRMINRIKEKEKKMNQFLENKLHGKLKLNQGESDRNKKFRIDVQPISGSGVSTNNDSRYCFQKAKRIIKINKRKFENKGKLERVVDVSFRKDKKILKKKNLPKLSRIEDDELMSGQSSVKNNYLSPDIDYNKQKKFWTGEDEKNSDKNSIKSKHSRKSRKPKRLGKITVTDKIGKNTAKSGSNGKTISVHPLSRSNDKSSITLQDTSKRVFGSMVNKQPKRADPDSLNNNSFTLSRKSSQSSQKGFATLVNRLGSKKNTIMNKADHRRKILLNMKNRNCTYNPKYQKSIFGRENENGDGVEINNDENKNLPRSRTMTMNNFEMISDIASEEKSDSFDDNKKETDKYMDVRDNRFGDFSMIKRVLNREDGKFYAMKIFEVEEVTKKLKKKFKKQSSDFLMNLSMKLIIKEQKILEKFGPESCVMNAIMTEFDTGEDGIKDKEILRIVMPYMKYGYLMSKCYLKHTNFDEKKLTENQAKKIFFNVAKGVKELHEKNIVHRNLNKKNILMKDEFNSKISDFALSLFLDKAQDDSINRENIFKGEENLNDFSKRLEPISSHMAPELWIDWKDITKKCDVWSFGVCLWETIFGIPPFFGVEEDELKKEVLFKKLVYPFRISEELEDLLENTLQRHSDERYCIDKVLEHAWFSSE